MAKQNSNFRNALVASALLNAALIVAACRASLVPGIEVLPPVNEVRIHLYIPQRVRRVAIALPDARTAERNPSDAPNQPPMPGEPATPIQVAAAASALNSAPQPSLPGATAIAGQPTPRVRQAVSIVSSQPSSGATSANMQTASSVIASPQTQPLPQPAAAAAPSPPTPAPGVEQQPAPAPYREPVPEPQRPAPAIEQPSAPAAPVRHPRSDLADGAVPEVIGNWPDMSLSSDIDPASLDSTVVVVTFEVDESGKPTHIRVKQSSGNSDVDDSARKAIQSMRFRPAQQGGEAISARMSHEWRLQ